MGVISCAVTHCEVQLRLKPTFFTIFISFLIEASNFAFHTTVPSNINIQQPPFGL